MKNCDVGTAKQRLLSPWFWIILSWLIFFFLATVGYHQYFVNAGLSDVSWFDCSYAAIQIFIMEFQGDFDAPKPLTLEIARWLAPLALSVGLLQAILTILQAQTVFFRMLFVRRHVIICGGNAMMRQLASDLITRGRRVVLIDSSIDQESRLRWCGSRRLITIKDNPMDVHVLNSAKIARADLLITMMESDRDNISVALLAADCSAARTTEHSLRIYTRLEDPALFDLLKSFCESRKETCTSFTLRTFSIDQNLIRIIFKKYPFDVLNDQKTLAKQVHIVIPDLDHYGSKMVIYAARNGHYLHGMRTTIHLVSQDAKTQVDLLLSKFPQLTDCCDLHACPIMDSSLFPSAVCAITENLPAGTATSVFITDDDFLAFSHLVTLKDLAATHQGLRVYIKGSPSSPILSYMKESQHQSGLYFLPEIGDACGCEAVLMESLDRLASVIHGEWYKEEEACMAKQLKAGKSCTPKPTFKPWSELTESQKDASRWQADHIPIKIRAAGLTLEQAVSCEAWRNLCSETIESLSEMEHERWCAEKRMAGWKYAEKRDDAYLRHTDLVPYAELDELTKQYDRDTIQKICQYLNTQSALSEERP